MIIIQHLRKTQTVEAAATFLVILYQFKITEDSGNSL